MATIVQVELQSGTSRRTCWLDPSKKFHVGDQVTLKNSEDPDRRWDVMTISASRDASDIRTDWKVGGRS